MSVFIKPWWIKNVWRRVVPSDVRFAVTLRSRDLSNDAVAAFTDYALTHAKLRRHPVAGDPREEHADARGVGPGRAAGDVT